MRVAQRNGPSTIIPLKAWCCLAILAATSACAANVGDPKNPTALSQALQDAYKNGDRASTINPGVYRLPCKIKDSKHLIVLEGWKDTVIKADGVTLMVNGTGKHWLNMSLVVMKRCANVTWAGGILTQNDPSCYQGRALRTQTQFAQPTETS